MPQHHVKLVQSRPGSQSRASEAAAMTRLTASVCAGVIGASFGQRLYDRGLAIPTSHRVIGWLVVALVMLQLTAFALRPSLVGTAEP